MFTQIVLDDTIILIFKNISFSFFKKTGVIFSFEKQLHKNWLKNLNNIYIAMDNGFELRKLPDRISFTLSC